MSFRHVLFHLFLFLQKECSFVEFFFVATLIIPYVDFNRARVSIQEWTKHNSINEVWKVPLRKITADKPVSLVCAICRHSAVSFVQ